MLSNTYIDKARSMGGVLRSISALGELCKEAKFKIGIRGFAEVPSESYAIFAKDRQAMIEKIKKETEAALRDYDKLLQKAQQGDAYAKIGFIPASMMIFESCLIIARCAINSEPGNDDRVAEALKFMKHAFDMKQYLDGQVHTSSWRPVFGSDLRTLTVDLNLLEEEIERVSPQTSFGTENCAEAMAKMSLTPAYSSLSQTSAGSSASDQLMDQCKEIEDLLQQINAEIVGDSEYQIAPSEILYKQFVARHPDDERIGSLTSKVESILGQWQEIRGNALCYTSDQVYEVSMIAIQGCILLGRCAIHSEQENSIKYSKADKFDKQAKKIIQYVNGSDVYSRTKPFKPLENLEEEYWLLQQEVTPLYVALLPKTSIAASSSEQARALASSVNAPTLE